MKTLSILTIPILTILYFPGLNGQLMDFDSLYQNDQAFKEQIDSRPEFQDLFHSDEVIKLSIESDFKNLIKRKYKGEYQPATFKYYLNDTVVVTREIKIKPRGNMRRKTCYFPPLMLNFPKKEAVINQIHDFDKMKMVLDCKRGNTYEQYLLSEYYAYKLYNIITDYSFRVRLFEITLIDTNEKMKDLKSYAYIIENVDQLAIRHNAIPIETQNIRDDYTDLNTLSNGYLFQYLIGNTDWSIPGKHNIEIIKSKDPTILTPHFIPYDFDYAGIVNTNYAVPDERLGIGTVRERVYRGVCIDESYIHKAVKNFLDSKEKIYALYNSSGMLDKNNLQSTLKYLDDFYEIIENDKTLRRNILEECRE